MNYNEIIVGKDLTTQNYKYELLIRAAGGIYQPVILDGIELTQERKGAPSSLVFTVIKDDNIAFEHGNQVQLKVNDQPVFMGWVFIKSRDKQHHIKVTAYDQLRYLKNKDTYMYTNKTASEVIKHLASMFNLKTGSIANTGYTIGSRIESNTTLFDMIQNALDVTLVQTGELFCLYDDFGKLTLKNIKDMKCNITIDAETAENFDYTSTIDNNTYNQIKLVRENKDKSKLEVFIERDNNNIGNWGVLQFFDTIQEGVNGGARAKMILDVCNRVQRSLTVKGCFGDLSVRAGCFIPVTLNLGDKIIDNKRLLCERVVHHFKNDHHTMDLAVIGNKFLY